VKKDKSEKIISRTIQRYMSMNVTALHTSRCLATHDS